MGISLVCDLVLHYTTFLPLFLVGKARLNIIIARIFPEVSQHIFSLVNYQPINTRRGFVQNYTWTSASVIFLFVYCCVCWCEERGEQ